MAIHSIFFDLGNVIINLKPEAAWWEEDILPYFDAGEVARMMEADLFNAYETGMIDDDTFRMELHMARKYDSEPSVVDNCWNAMLQDIPAERVALLKALSEQYELYLLSNTNNIHLQHILHYCEREFGYPIFDTLFKQCFYSHQLGLRKPDKEIYLQAWEAAGASFEGSLYIDDKAANLLVPAEMGAVTLHIDPALGFEQQLPPLLAL
jgi:glucose-1-phosphatase